MNKIITISREFGSGGRELGKRLAEDLGYAYYDQEIIRQIANRTGMAEKYVEHMTDTPPVYSYPIHIGLSFMFLENPVWEQNQRIFKEQCDVIHEAAERSNCVFVGRCADYILQDYKPFRLFVYSSMEAKMKRCREKGSEPADMSDRELQRKIKAINKNRSQYYEFFTNQKWSDPLNYDLCINTTGHSIKNIAQAVANLEMQEALK